MKKMTLAVAAAAIVSLGAGAASAQSFSPVNGTGTATGTLYLKHLLPSTSTCTLSGLPVKAISSSLVETTWTGNFGLCTQAALAGVTAAAKWSITPNGASAVKIQTQRINTILGYCPPKLLDATVVSKTASSVTLSIPHQTWAGQLTGTCEVSGTVTVSGITY